MSEGDENQAGPCDVKRERGEQLWRGDDDDDREKRVGQKSSRECEEETSRQVLSSLHLLLSTHSNLSPLSCQPNHESLNRES